MKCQATRHNKTLKLLLSAIVWNQQTFKVYLCGGLCVGVIYKSNYHPKRFPNEKRMTSKFCTPKRFKVIAFKKIWLQEQLSLWATAFMNEKGQTFYSLCDRRNTWSISFLPAGLVRFYFVRIIIRGDIYNFWPHWPAIKQIKHLTSSKPVLNQLKPSSKFTLKEGSSSEPVQSGSEQIKNSSIQSSP